MENMDLQRRWSRPPYKPAPATAAMLEEENTTEMKKQNKKLFSDYRKRAK